MKKFPYLLAGAAVVALLAWFLHRAERGGWREEAVPPGTALLGGFEVNEVATVRLAGPDGTVTLRRGGAGWGVAERGGHAADFERMAALVRGLADLQALQSVPLAESDRGQLTLRAPGDDVPGGEAGVLVELSDANGAPVRSLLLGRMHFTPPQGARPGTTGSITGRYVFLNDRPGHAYLVPQSFDGVSTKPAEWLDKTFVRPGAPARVEVKGPGRDRTWTLEREAQGVPWKLAGLRRNQTTDQARAGTVETMLSGMAVADVADGPDDPRIGPLAAKPVTVTVDSFDGVRHVFTIGEGDGDNLPVKVVAESLWSEESGPVDGPPQEQAGEEEAEQGKLREDKLAVAKKFEGMVVFVPRNFVEPFLAARSAFVGAPSKPDPQSRATSP